MRAEKIAFTMAEYRPSSEVSAEPRLTVWTWEEPTISVGFLHPGIAFPRGIPGVRRPTGGGAILHDDEWTYGALVPLDDPRLGGTLDTATRAITAVFAEALERAYGIRVDPVEPSGQPGAKAGGNTPLGPACFAQKLGYELSVGGRKLMGSAQRRGRNVLLQQGSLLVGPGQERLARYLDGAGDVFERALAERAVTLQDLLGRRPDPAPFAAALEAGWMDRVSSR